MTYHCEFRDTKTVVARRILGFVPQIDSRIVIDGEIYTILRIGHDLDNSDIDAIATVLVVQKQ